jgi:hypothetical protein
MSIIYLLVFIWILFTIVPLSPYKFNPDFVIGARTETEKAEAFGGIPHIIV